MKIKHALIFIMSNLIIMASCKNETISLQVVNLKIDTVLYQLSDSTFFSDVRSICFYNNKYFISDYNRDQLFILNKDLQLLRTLGRKGKGPGEFSGISHLFVSNDSIFAFNDFKRTIELYKFSGYLRTIYPPASIKLSSSTRYFGHNNSLYLSNSDANYSIGKYNYQTKAISHFGKVKQFGTQKQTTIKNNRHLIRYNDLLISIPICQTIIEIYNTDNELITEFDIGKVTQVNDLVLYADELNLPENSFLTFFSDVCIFENRLFLILLSANNKEHYNNKILELEIKGNSIVAKRILEVPTNWISTISVSQKHILAFNNSNNRLIQFSYE